MQKRFLFEVSNITCVCSAWLPLTGLERLEYSFINVGPAFGGRRMSLPCDENNFGGHSLLQYLLVPSDLPSIFWQLIYHLFDSQLDEMGIDCEGLK